MSGNAEVDVFEAEVATDNPLGVGRGAKYCRIITNSQVHGPLARSSNGRNFFRKSLDQVLFPVPVTSCFWHGQSLITSGSGEYCLPDYTGEAAGKANGQPSEREI